MYRDLAMKKRFILCIILVLLVSSPLLAVELKFNTQDFSPFSYLSDGKVSGPASEIIKAVCRRINATCTFKLGVWKDAQQEVREGKANAMFVIGWNRGRSKWLYFSPQILQTEYGFFVPKGNSLTFSEIRDLSGYRIGVYGPSNTARSLEKVRQRMEKDKTMTPIEIDMQPDDIAIFKNLNSRQRTLNSVFSNRDVGNDIIRKHKLNNLRYAGAQRTLNYFIGFSKQYTDKNLVNRFNKAFVNLYTQGQIEQILKRYAMKPAPIEPYIIAFYNNK